MITLPNGRRIRAHGTPSAYNAGCKCPDCTEVARARMAANRERMAKQGLPDGDPRHGTANGYTNWGCRCEPCTKAHNAEVRAYVNRTKDERRARITSDDPRHGTPGFYVYHGCRCEKCTVAYAQYRREHGHWRDIWPEGSPEQG